MKTAVSKALPVLDAEGYTLCPDCNSCVKCGTIGLASLENRHRGTKICKAAQEKRDKAKTRKNGTILRFLKSKATNGFHRNSLTHWMGVYADWSWWFIGRGPQMQTSRLRDSVGKCLVSWALIHLLIHLMCLVSPPVCGTWARATSLGVHGLWGVGARTRGEAPTQMMSYYYIWMCAWLR